MWYDVIKETNKGERVKYLNQIEQQKFKVLNQELEHYQILHKVYGDMWGPKSNEVIHLNKKIYDIKFQILEILNNNRGL